MEEGNLMKQGASWFKYMGLLVTYFENGPRQWVIVS